MPKVGKVTWINFKSGDVGSWRNLTYQGERWLLLVERTRKSTHPSTGRRTRTCENRELRLGCSWHLRGLILPSLHQWFLPLQPECRRELGCVSPIVLQSGAVTTSSLLHGGQYFYLKKCFISYNKTWEGREGSGRGGSGPFQCVGWLPSWEEHEWPLGWHAFLSLACTKIDKQKRVRERHRERNFPITVEWKFLWTN